MELLGRSQGWNGAGLGEPGLSPHGHFQELGFLWVLRGSLLGECTGTGSAGAARGGFPPGIPGQRAVPSRRALGAPELPPFISPSPRSVSRCWERLRAAVVKRILSMPPVDGFSPLLFIQTPSSAVDSPPLPGRLHFQNFLQVSGWQKMVVTDCTCEESPSNHRICTTLGK